MNPLELLSYLRQLGVRVSLNGDKVRLEAPAGVLTPKMREIVLKHKPALMALLSGGSCMVELRPGVSVRIYPSRRSCIEAGHCLQLTRESDCCLFPLTWCWGYCTSRPVLKVIHGTAADTRPREEVAAIE